MNQNERELYEVTRQLVPPNYIILIDLDSGETYRHNQQDYQSTIPSIGSTIEIYVKHHNDDRLDYFKKFKVEGINYGVDNFTIGLRKVK